MSLKLPFDDMTGLQRIVKLYGGITINGQRFIWDYAKNKAVPMPSIKKKKKIRAKKVES